MSAKIRSQNPWRKSCLRSGCRKTSLRSSSGAQLNERKRFERVIRSCNALILKNVGNLDGQKIEKVIVIIKEIAHFLIKVWSCQNMCEA